MTAGDGRPFGVILAGGRSRRMGRDKALTPLAGQPMIAHVIARLQPQVLALAINANGDTTRLAAFGLPVIPDETGEFEGPLAGILAGLTAAAAAGAGHLVCTPVDAPFLPIDLVARLASATGDAPVAVAASVSGGHYTTALIPVALADDLRAHLAGQGDRRVAAWFRRHGMIEVSFAGAPDPFLNLNTPDDIARAEAALMGRAGPHPV